MAKRSGATGKCYNHRKRPVRATNKTLCSEKSVAIFYFPIPISRPLLQNQIFFCKFVQTRTAIIGADLIV
jgi:hypothetical protein